MCGIIGYAGSQNALPILLRGLEHLEYRGYDSAGIACFEEGRGELVVAKEKGKLAELKEQLKGLSFSSHLGMGHTRWATHGEPSRANAHPHLDNSKRIVLIHNGIVENYAELRQKLCRRGFRFYSQTDTEVAVNLISSYYRKGDFQGAFLKAVRQMRGYFTFVVFCKEEPGRLYFFKRSNPLVIGLGHGENFVASDVPAILSFTKKVIYVEDDEYGILSRDGVQLFSLRTRQPVKRAAEDILWDISEAKKGGYPHFMLKEIYEQPRVLKEIFSDRLGPKGEIRFDTLGRNFPRAMKQVRRVYFVSCGTAHHAGLVGAGMIESIAGIPAQNQVSSEFRYTDPIIGKQDLVVLITQSGETADTLAALREARVRGARTLAVVNVVGSTIAREADAVIYTHAGPEIGVASTKAYTAQLATLLLFSIYLAKIRRKIPDKQAKRLIAEMKKLPDASEKVLKQIGVVEKVAAEHSHRRNFLFLGRGYNFATALEGALKLKEISYAHAHGYAAGEMKHGPIALIDHEQPVICIAPESRTYDKMMTNIEEIRARGGIVIAIGTEQDKRLRSLAQGYFAIPRCSEALTSILSVILLQLFAYKIAVLNDRDVDQPRNLAKSVTVE
ncbi:MAG: glutamine--fructose-6-phosphate transaminase (isomerizing) [Candidatus Omnitrophota bacterium]